MRGSGGKLPHAETSAIGQVKKSQENRPPACGSRRITGTNLMGTGILPEKLMACPEFRFPQSDFLSFSTEHAQGHFVSPARGMDLCAQKNNDNLVLRIPMVRTIRLMAVRKYRSIFQQDLVLSE